MRFPVLDANDSKSIDMEQLCRMVDHFLANGFTYIVLFGIRFYGIRICHVFRMASQMIGYICFWISHGNFYPACQKTTVIFRKVCSETGQLGFPDQFFKFKRVCLH